MSGDRPPRWEDDDGLLGGDDQMDAETEARLREVAAYLAAAPAPPLPDVFTARISAAIEAEAAARASSPAPRASSPAPAASLPADGEPSSEPSIADGHSVAGRRRGRAGPRGRLRSRPLLVTTSAVACLVLIGFAILLSRGGSSPSSSAASSAMKASSAAGPARNFGANEVGPVSGASSTAGASFSVTESGTAYQKATLAAQVRARLTADNVASGTVPGPTATSGASSGITPSAVPSAVPSAGSAVTSATPSPQLRGCVLSLTSGALPKLVDQATYQGEPAYVIAGTSRVWVVGRGCTAASTQLIVSASLAG